MAIPFAHARENELDVGLAYARKTYRVDLSRETLRILFNATGDLSVVLTGRDRFQRAKKQVLDTQLAQRTKNERERFVAYSGAIGKMGSDRSALARKMRAAPKKRQRPAPAQHRPPVTLFLRGDQYAFI